MKHSLRVRLVLAVCGVLAVVLLALSLVLYVVFARALWRQFDGRLLGDAVAVAGMAEDDSPEPEFEPETLPEFDGIRTPAYFEAWLDDGRVLARSPSLRSFDLARKAGLVAPTYADLVLPDARPGRALQLRQPLRVDEAPNAGSSAPRVSERFVTVVVARGTEEVTDTLALVRRWLLMLALLALLGASSAALIAVTRGLRSTRALASAVAGLDASQLDRTLPMKGLPDEIAPVVAKMNELFARLRESFAREKRFTADVSHELRTPLAALRTMLEVTASRDRSTPEYRIAIAEALAVVLLMQTLCENLLALVRLDTGRVPLRRQEVPLHDLVQSCWHPFAGAARERGLIFKNEVDRGTSMNTDPDQLRVIVSNLLSNAASYTDQDGTILVRSRVGETDAVLEIYDTGPQIPDEDMPHIFERFFRGDSMRSGGTHCGIGLTLARRVADVLSLTVTARNTFDGGVSFALSSSLKGS